MTTTDAMQLTDRQKAAIREMADLERQYGRTFLLNSLHQVRQALRRKYSVSSNDGTSK